MIRPAEAGCRELPVGARRIRRHQTGAVDSKSIDKGALVLLSSYHWPGNIRELENTVSCAAVSVPSNVIRANDEQFLHPPEVPVVTPREQLSSLREAKRVHIQRVLEGVAWNKKQAAKNIEIGLGTLYRKIADYNLEPSPHSSATTAVARPSC